MTTESKYNPDATPEQEKDEAKLNPSFDQSLPPAHRLNDFLGRYHICLNGVRAHEPFEIGEEDRVIGRCDSAHKEEIIDFVVHHLIRYPRTPKGMTQPTTEKAEWEREFDEAVKKVGCGRGGNECIEWHGVCPDAVKPLIRSLVETERQKAMKGLKERVRLELKYHRDGVCPTPTDCILFSSYPSPQSPQKE